MQTADNGWSKLLSTIEIKLHSRYTTNSPGASLKLKNCKVFTDTIDYLGHIIPPRWLKITSCTTDKIRELKAPTSLKKLSSFFGLRNNLRRFVPNLTRLAVSLSKRLQKDEELKFWSFIVKETRALNVLKNVFTLPPIFALPISCAHIILHTDVCGVQIRRINLPELAGDTVRASKYWSRALNHA